MLILLELLFAITVVLAIGILLVRLLLGRISRDSWAEVLGYSFGAGLGLVCLLSFCLAVWRIPLSKLNILLLEAALLLFLAAANWLFRPPLRWPSINSRSAVRLNGFEWLCLGVAAYSTLLVLVDTFSQPLLAFDSRSIWGMKAKVFYSQGGLYGEDFFDPARLHAHQQYPLLVPLSESLLYHHLGRLDDRWGKAFFPCFFLAMILVIYGGLRRFFSRGYSLAGVVLFSGLPVFVIFPHGSASSGYADFPLAYFITAFAMVLFGWVHSGKRADLSMASLFGAFALFTKNEGTALWVIVVACFALLLSFSTARPFHKMLDLALSCALSLLLLIPWFTLRPRLVLNDENYPAMFTPENISNGIGRLPYVIKGLFREILLKPHLWNVVGWMVLAILTAMTMRSWRMRHSVFFIIPSLYSGLLVLMFLVTPWRVEDLIPISLTRLLMHTAPLMLIWILFQAAALELVPAEWTGFSGYSRAMRDPQGNGERFG